MQEHSEACEPIIQDWLESMGRIPSNSDQSDIHERDGDYLLCPVHQNIVSLRCVRPCIKISQANTDLYHARLYMSSIGFQPPGIVRMKVGATIECGGWRFRGIHLHEVIQQVFIYHGELTDDDEPWPPLLNVNDSGRPTPADVRFAQRTAVAGPVYVVGNSRGIVTPLPANANDHGPDFFPSAFRVIDRDERRNRSHEKYRFTCPCTPWYACRLSTSAIHTTCFGSSSDRMVDLLTIPRQCALSTATTTLQTTTDCGSGTC